jgi:hypothetical protein
MDFVVFSMLTVLKIPLLSDELSFTGSLLLASSWEAMGTVASSWDAMGTLRSCEFASWVHVG